MNIASKLILSVGKLLKRFWSKGFTKEDKEMINTRLIGQNGIELPECSNPHSDIYYTCPIHNMRSSIHANLQQEHMHQTHPDVADAATEPPLHMLIIESDMRSSEHHAAKPKLSRVWRHRIITTCRDAGCNRGHKHIHPVLCIHSGSKLIYSGYIIHLEDLVSRGNGTFCKAVLVKCKPQAQVKYIKYYGKKVSTVLASDVWHLAVQKTKPVSMVKAEKVKDIKDKLNYCLDSPSIICELEPQLETLEAQVKAQVSLLQFRLEPEFLSTSVKARPSHYGKGEVSITIKMN